MFGHSASVDTRLEIRRALERGRSATDDVLAPVSDEVLAAQLAPGVPPLVWSYAHVARFEELWILRTIGGARPIPDVHDHVYDAFRRERSNGAKLPTLSPNAVRAYANDVRERALDVLERVDLEAPDVLVRRGFVFGLVLQNELQSQEAMLETLQCRTERRVPGDRGIGAGSCARRPGRDRGAGRRRSRSERPTSRGRTTTSSSPTRSSSSRSGSTAPR